MFRFLFRERLKISSDFFHIQINNLDYIVEKEDVERYYIAVNNENAKSLLTENKVADIHPLYFTKISWKIIRNLNQYLDRPVNEKILKTIVHQSEYISFYNELPLPANLKVVSKIWSILSHKKGTKILIRFDYFSDQKHIATEYSGGLLFGVKYSGEDKTRGIIPKTEKINNAAVWEEKIEIDKGLSYIYADKADIDAPIHTNPKFARSIGLPDIILQGTCTLAKSLNLILVHESTGSFEEIKSISGKFTGMLVLPNNITVRLLKNENKICNFEVLNMKGEFVIRGGEIIFN